MVKVYLFDKKGRATDFVDVPYLTIFKLYVLGWLGFVALGILGLVVLGIAGW